MSGLRASAICTGSDIDQGQRKSLNVRFDGGVGFQCLRRRGCDHGQKRATRRHRHRHNSWSWCRHSERARCWLKCCDIKLQSGTRQNATSPSVKRARFPTRARGVTATRSSARPRSTMSSLKSLSKKNALTRTSTFVRRQSHRRIGICRRGLLRGSTRSTSGCL